MATFLLIKNERKIKKPKLNWQPVFFLHIFSNNVFTHHGNYPTIIWLNSTIGLLIIIKSDRTLLTEIEAAKHLLFFVWLQHGAVQNADSGQTKPHHEKKKLTISIWKRFFNLILLFVRCCVYLLSLQRAHLVSLPFLNYKMCTHIFVVFFLSIRIYKYAFIHVRFLIYRIFIDYFLCLQIEFAFLLAFAANLLIAHVLRVPLRRLLCVFFSLAWLAKQCNSYLGEFGR